MLKWVWIAWWGTGTGCSVVTVRSMISWLSSSPNQNSDHAVGDSNLNTSQCSLFLLTFSGSRLTLFCLVMNCKGSICMRETNGSLYISILNKLSSPAVLCWDPQMFSQAVYLFSLLHYILTSVTKSEKLLALEIFLSYMCIWRKLFQFFCCWQMLAFFLYILRAFTILSLVLPFILFLDTIF